MNLDKFRRESEKKIWSRLNNLENLSILYGGNTNRIDHILNLAVSCLDPGEAHLEVGVMNGHTLEAASKGNDDKVKYGVDIEFHKEVQQLTQTVPNLFFRQQNFLQMNPKDFLRHPIGSYFYDADHSYDATLVGLEKIIPFLADKAIIFMDDMHGYSGVYNAWRYFMRNHADQFTIVHEFFTPDEFRSVLVNYRNGWGDGFAIAEFQRKFEPREVIEYIAVDRYLKRGQFVNEPRVFYPKELKHLHGKEEVPFMTFDDVYEEVKDITLTQKDRLWHIWDKAQWVRDLPGDAAELGSFKGGASKLIYRAFNGEKTVHLFDTFSGVPASKFPGNDMGFEGGFPCSEEQVRANLADCEGVVFHPGIVPDTLADVADASFCLIYLDMDIYTPTITALRFLWPRLVRGGVILLDDAGEPGLIDIDKAVAEFSREFNVKVYRLLQYQSMLIKE